MLETVGISVHGFQYFDKQADTIFRVTLNSAVDKESRNEIEDYLSSEYIILYSAECTKLNNDIGLGEFFDVLVRNDLRSGMVYDLAEIHHSALVTISPADQAMDKDKLGDKCIPELFYTKDHIPYCIGISLKDETNPLSHGMLHTTENLEKIKTTKYFLYREDSIIERDVLMCSEDLFNGIEDTNNMDTLDEDLKNTVLEVVEDLVNNLEDEGLGEISISELKQGITLFQLPELPPISTRSVLIKNCLVRVVQNLELEEVDDND